MKYKKILKKLYEKHYEVLYNIWRTIVILFKSVSVTVISVFLWYTFRPEIYALCGLTVDGALAVELGSDLTVFMSAMLYGALQGFVINRIMGQNNRIQSAIDVLNAITFLEERDRRTSPLVHIMMFFVSSITIGMASLYQYTTIQIAIYAIGTSVFLAALAFFIAVELDNPFDGASRIPPKKIHKGWMTMTIDDIRSGKVPHFEQKIEEKNISQLK